MSLYLCTYFLKAFRIWILGNVFLNISLKKYPCGEAQWFVFILVNLKCILQISLKMKLLLQNINLDKY
jgi:hypothetical protein